MRTLHIVLKEFKMGNFIWKRECCGTWLDDAFEWMNKLPLLNREKAYILSTEHNFFVVYPEGVKEK